MSVQYTDTNTYRVSEEHPDAYPNAPDDWFEYQVELVCSDCGALIDTFDSLFETYNGMQNQRLTKEEAEKAANGIAEDFHREGPEGIFTTTKCGCDRRRKDEQTTTRTPQ